MEPCRIDDTARIYQYNGTRKSGQDLLYHRTLCIRQVIVSARIGPLLERRHLRQFLPVLPCISRQLPVPAFSGKPADADHSRIRKAAGPPEQLLRQRRLHRFSRDAAFRILPEDLLPVKYRRIRLYAAVPGRLHAEQSFPDAPHIRRIHIAASAAALDIIKAAASEKRDPAALRKRKQCSLIFEKYRAFLCRFLGEADMLL